MMIDGIPLDIDGSRWFMELSGGLSKQLEPSLRLKRWLWDRLESLLSMLYRHKFFGRVSPRIFWGFFLGEPIGLAKIGDLYDVNRDMNRYTTNKTGRLQQSCGKFMGILWDHDGIRMGYRGIEQDLVGHAYMIIYVLFGDLTGSFPEVARMVNFHRGNHPQMALFQVSE